MSYILSILPQPTKRFFEGLRIYITCIRYRFHDVQSQEMNKLTLIANGFFVSIKTKLFPQQNRNLRTLIKDSLLVRMLI